MFATPSAARQPCQRVRLDFFARSPGRSLLRTGEMPSGNGGCSSETMRNMAETGASSK